MRSVAIALMLASGITPSSYDFLGLEIPTQYFADVTANPHLQNYEGDEDRASIALRIPLDAVLGQERAFSTKDNTPQSDLLIVLSKAERSRIDRTNDHIWSEIQSRNGRFKDAYAEKDPETEFFKVFPSANTTFTWHVVAQDPFESATKEAGTIIGICSEKSNGVTCSVDYMVDDNLLAELSSLDYKYLPCLDSIQKGTQKIILSWRHENRE